MASTSWKSGVSASWTVGADWSTGTVPGVNDDATIAASGTYTVSDVVTTSIHSITLNAASATLSETSTLNLGTSITLTAGTFALSSGAINGGTIAVGGGTFLATGGTLNSVKIQGPFTVATNGANVNIGGSLVTTGTSGTGAGTINITGTTAIVNFLNTQTLDNATVNLGSSASGSPSRLVERDVSGSGTTLTLGASLNVVSNGGYGLILATGTGGNTNLINAGTIGFGSSGGLLEVSANQFTNQGTIAVKNGGTMDLLTGPYVLAAGETGINNGSITLSSGLLAVAGTFTNAGSMVATGGTMTIAGMFTNTGTFTANNTKVTVAGTVSGASILALLNNTSDTVSYNATYINTGAVLNVGSGSTIGTLTLNNSLPIIGGTIADAGGGFVYSTGTLTGVTYQGTMDLSANNSNLNIANSLVLTRSGGGAGAIKLTGTASILSFVGSQTVNSATVTLGSSTTSMARLQERDVAGTGATLTLGSSLNVVAASGGSGVILSVGTVSNDTLINQGTVQVGTTASIIELSANSFTNTGKLLVSNGTLDVLTGPFTPPAGETGTSSGTITQSGGLLAFGGTFTNTGSITVSGGTLTLGGTFTDSGTMTMNNATLNLGGVFRGVSFLNALNNTSDTVNVTGTYNNSGATLSVGSGTSLGSIDLIVGLPISGGTILDSGGGLLYDGGTLDGVTYVGTMDLGSGGDLNVLDGLIVQTGTLSRGIVDVSGGWSSLTFLNAQSVNNLTITLGDASGFTDSLYNAATGTLTLGSNMLIQDSAGLAQIYTYAAATTVNRGTIAVGGAGTFELLGNGGNFINAGSIGVTGGGSFGTYAFTGNSQFSNTGTLSASSGSGITLEAGWANTGTISLTAGANLQLGSDTTTNWGSVGTITATSATLALQGVFTTAQLSQLTLSNDLTQIEGLLVNTGTTLSVGSGSALGALTMLGGTITGGTIVDAGGGIVLGDGTLDAITYRGAVTITANGDVWITNGLTALNSAGTGNGTIYLNTGGAGLYVGDTETLNNATLRMGDSSFETDFIESYVYPGAGTLTLGSGLTIAQYTGDAAIYTAGGGSTVNNGSIVVTGGTFHDDYGTFINAGTISASGTASLYQDNVGLTNTGMIKAATGADIALSAGWINNGTISMTGGGDLQLGSDTTTTWGTIGTIIASNSTLDLYGAFTTAQILQLSLTNDSVNIDGALSNNSATLNIGSGKVLASLGPTSGGVIQGGMIVDAGGGMLAEGGTLDGVTYRGTLAIGGAGTLNVIDGLTLQTASGGQPGKMTLTGGGSNLVVGDSETIDNATITIGDSSGTMDLITNGGANGNTVTLGANLLLQQTTGSAQLLNTGGNDIINNLGQIVVSSGSLDVSGGDFTNSGTMTVSSGGTINFDPGTFANLANSVLTGGVYVINSATMELAAATFVAELNADLTLNGTAAVVQTPASSGQTSMDSTLHTIDAGGALRLLGGRSLALKAAFQEKGLLQLGGGTLSDNSTLTLTGTILGYGTVSGPISDGGLIEANGGLLTVSGSLTGSGSMQIDSGATLELTGAASLASNLVGSGSTLQLDAATYYTGTINGFSLGDALVLGGVTASSASIASGKLNILLTSGSTLSYTVGGSFSGLAVRTSVSGSTTTVTLASAAPTQITGVIDNRGSTLSCGNGVNYTLDGGTVLGGTIADAGGGMSIGFGTLDGVLYKGAITVGAGGLLTVVDGLTMQTVSGATPGSMSLTGGGSTLNVADTETLDNATISIGDASGTTDVLWSGGPNGNTVTLGSHLVLQQSTGSAQILAGGTSDVTINRGQINVSGGSLDINGGSFTNSGTMSVSGGGTITLEPGALSNFAGSTLTGGVYVVGAGSTFELAPNSFIATISADLTLSGTGSQMETLNTSNVETPVDGTLRTISTTGVLRVLGGRALTLKSGLAAQGLLQLGGGTLSDSSTTNITGTLTGFGTVTGSVTDGGLIDASGGKLTLVNIASGTGKMQVEAGATLEVGTTNALTTNLAGTGGTLLLDKPTTFTGTINGFTQGDTIVLAGVTASSASIASGTLSIALTTGKTVTYTVGGSFTGLTVQTATVGGNTNVTLASSPQTPARASVQVASSKVAATATTSITAANVALSKPSFVSVTDKAAAPKVLTSSTHVATADLGFKTAVGAMVEPSASTHGATSSVLGSTAALQLAAAIDHHAVTLAAHH